MKVEKMETLGVNVRDVRKAAAFFADLFELDFGEFVFGGNSGSSSTHKSDDDPSQLGAQAIRVAMDRNGFFEFLETAKSPEDEGFRNIHFKVPDMNVAKREMEQRGIKFLAETHIGGVWETVYNPAELFGIRLCFVQYSGPSLIDAVLTGESRSDCNSAILVPDDSSRVADDSNGVRPSAISSVKHF